MMTNTEPRSGWIFREGDRWRNRLLEAIAGSQKGAVIWTAAAQGQGLNLAGISSPRR